MTNLSPAQRGGSTASRGRVLDRLQVNDFILTHRWTSLNAFAGEVTLAGLRTLMADPDVLMVDEDPIAYMDLAETAALIRVDQVRGAGTTGRGRDRGRARHRCRPPTTRTSATAWPPSSASAIPPAAPGCCPNGTAEQSGAGAAEDDNGHGTNVTGIITSDGRVAPPGIAPDAMVVVVKVLDKTGAGTSTGILSALDFIINKHPEVKVVNLSLGLGNLFPGRVRFRGFVHHRLRVRGQHAARTGSGLLRLQREQRLELADRGARLHRQRHRGGRRLQGRRGDDHLRLYGRHHRRRPRRLLLEQRQPGRRPRSGAPVTSAGIGGGVSTFVGTSQACPVAAGVAALILSAHPGLSPDAVEAAMKNTGVTVTDPKNGLSFRRIDAKAAVDSVQ